MLRQRLTDRRTLGMIGGLYLALGLVIPWSVYLIPWVCGSQQNCSQISTAFLPRTLSGLAYLRMLDPAYLPHLTVIALINLLPVGVGVIALVLNVWGTAAHIHSGLVRLYLALVVVLGLTVAFKGGIFVITTPDLQGNEVANFLSLLLMILSFVALWRNYRWWRAEAAIQTNARL